MGHAKICIFIIVRVHVLVLECPLAMCIYIEVYIFYNVHGKAKDIASNFIDMFSVHVHLLPLNK